MEVFSKFWSIIVGFVLIFICPVYITEMRVKALSDIEIVNLADRFLDKVKYSGYIDRQELNSLYTSLAKITLDKEFKLLHKRRAVRPVFNKGEVVDSKEFYVEVLDEEIRNDLKQNSKYNFKIGDEICCIISPKTKIFNVFPEKIIELGGMIENEYIKN